MSKRRREESDVDLPGGSAHITTSPLSPLRSDLPPLETMEPLSPSDMSFNPILTPGTLPSPKHEECFDQGEFSELHSENVYDKNVYDNIRADSGCSPYKENPFNVPFESVAGPSHVSENIQAVVPDSSIRESLSGLAVSLPSLETDGFSDKLPEQPFPCTESNLPTFTFDDPSVIFHHYDNLKSSEEEELPFYDAIEEFGEFCMRDDCQEETDPHHTSSEVSEGEAGCPNVGCASSLYFDALDSQPTISSDLPTSDPPLYDGASISVNEAMTAVLTFMLGCKVSGEVMNHLIALVNLLLPPGHRFISSLFSFHKYFEKIKTPLNLIHYCTVCTQSLKDKDSLCDKCGAATKVGFYIHVPLIDQLRSLYARRGFVDLLSYRHKRAKKAADNLEDIYDGSLYKCIDSLLTSPLDISLTWNTDGISLYKSSNFQVWPIYFSINELPPELRHKEENLLLGGLAFGYEKPHPNLLMKPIYEELKCLERGVEVLVHGKETPDSVKCCVLCGTADAPAKALVMRMNQFNGFHGCHCCYCEGEKSDRTGQVFVYPFQENLEPRSREAYCEDLKNQSNGIKGPTYLFWMVQSFFLLSTAVDVMHCVYIGVCRQIYSLWTSPEYFKLVFGEKAEKKPLLELLSAIFCSFRAPHYFDRPPRSLHHINYFKASEFRTWLFSTALPVFSKHMNEPYFSHFKKLVCGVALLNQASVSTSDVQLAREVLTSFVREFQELFGLRNMSYNVHCLLHLPDTVLALGPLWVSSCFPFENVNGILSRLVHGTRYAGCQIQSNLGILRQIPSMINSLQNNLVKSYCSNVMSYRRHLTITFKLGPKTFIIGKIVSSHVFSVPNCLDVIRNTFPNKKLNFFYRLKKDGFLYVSEEYGRGIRDSTNVLCKFSNRGSIFGSVKIFVKVQSCQCENNYCHHPSTSYALLQSFTASHPFAIDNPKATIFSIFECTPTENLSIVEVKHLTAVCFKMCVETSMFLSVPVNYHEME